MNLYFAMALVAAGFTLSAAAADTPTAYKPARSSDGHIELEGMWRNSNLTPLERPAKISHPILTAVEAASLTREYFDAGNGMPDDPGRLLENRSYESIQGEYRSSVIIDPADGKLPWTEAHKNDQAALRRITRESVVTTRSTSCSRISG